MGSNSFLLSDAAGQGFDAVLLARHNMPTST